MKKIVLHIGLHKTGSTAIQSAFHGFNNGITKYADLGYENHSIPFYTAYSGQHQNYHIWQKEGLTTKQIDLKKVESLKKIKQVISSSTSDNIIISGEDISLLPVSALQDLRRVFDAKTKIEVIAYVRDPISFIISNFQEDIKNGKNVEIPSPPHYKSRIEKFLTVFGPENVVIRHFHRNHLHEQDVIKDFAELVGVDAPKSGTIANKSLSTETVKIIYLLNQMIPTVGETKENIQARKRMIDHAMDTFPGKFDLPIDLISCRVDEDDNDWLFSATGIDFRKPRLDSKPFSKQALDQYLSAIDPTTVITLQDYLKQECGLRTVPQDTKFLLARYFMSFIATNYKRNYLFNAKLYLELNPDVKAAGMNPYQHYIQYGIKEGRRTN